MADLKTPTLEVKKASKKEVTRERRTIRLEVKLFEPTKDRFPRYNVRELKEKFLRENFGSDTDKSSTLPLDESASVSGPSFSDHDEDDDVARMAKKLEEKYGNGTAYDMSDKGAGYDENDSFIDNTEAFDETLVSDTPCGGFYINSGPLKFNEKKETIGMSSGSGTNGTPKAEKNPGTKKRSVGSLSSLESDGCEETGDKPKKPKKNKMKKQKRKESVEPQKPCKEIAIKDMLRFQRDNLLKTKTESPKHNRNRIVSDDDESDADSIALSETSNDSDVKFVDTPVLSCPSDLPEDIVKKIDEFNGVSEGKTSDQILTNPQLFQILTEIEGSKTVSVDQKIAIKTYLTSSIQCQDLYRKVQKERPWEQKSEVIPMETGPGAGMFETQENIVPVSVPAPFPISSRLPSID